MLPLFTCCFGGIEKTLSTDMKRFELSVRGSNVSKKCRDSRVFIREPKTWVLLTCSTSEDQLNLKKNYLYMIVAILQSHGLNQIEAEMLVDGYIRIIL